MYIYSALYNFVKLLFWAEKPLLSCVYVLGGGVEASSIAGFGESDILCCSERGRRIVISRLHLPVSSKFQPDTFIFVLASESEAIYCIKKITSSVENSAVEFLTSTFAPPRNDEILFTPSLNKSIYPRGALC